MSPGGRPRPSVRAPHLVSSGRTVRMWPKASEAPATPPTVTTGYPQKMRTGPDPCPGRPEAALADSCGDSALRNARDAECSCGASAGNLA